MNVVAITEVRGEKVVFGPHTVQRFRERVEPELGYYNAIRRLREYLRAGKLRPFPPPGLQTRHQAHPENVGYLTFRHDVGLVVLPLIEGEDGYAAPTCLTARRDT